MDEIWTEALQNYLLSQEFQGKIQKFTRKKAYLFDDTNQAKDADYDHRHHQVWKEFQDIVEQMLEKVLEELGGNFEALEKAIDERASAPPRGPRDAAEKEILSQLLTFDNFPEFAHMMRRVAGGGKQEADFSQEEYADENGENGRYGYNDGGEEDPRRRRKQMAKQLHEFGFDKELCKKAVLKFDDFDSCVAWCCDQNADNDEGNAGQGGNQDAPDPIDSARNNPEDFEIQIIMAQSILEAQSSGSLTPQDEAMVPWANAMVELATLMRSCDFDTDQLNASRRRRVEELRETLQREQQVVDRLASAPPSTGAPSAANSSAGQGMAEMSEEDREAERRRVEKMMENASKAEQDLAAMLTRVDELQKITEKQREKVTIYTRPPQSVKNDNLEEIYLFIKEMVHGGQDLAENKDKIHDYVFARIDSSAANLVPALLELMLEEEEMVMLNRHIRKALDPSAATEDDAGGDDNEEEEEEEDQQTNEDQTLQRDDDMSVGTVGTVDDEDNLSELERLNQKYQRDQAALEAAMERERQRQRRLLEERMRRRREKMRSQGYSEEDIDALEEKDKAALEERLNMLEKGLNNGLARKHEAVVRATAKAKRTLTEEESDDASKEMLEKLKEKYFEEENALRKLINGERNRQKNKLRDRLRKSREAKLAKYRAEGMSEKELQEVEERLMAEEEAKLQQLDESFDRQIEKALAAPKQRYYGALMASTVVSKEPSDSEEVPEDEDWLKALQDIKDRHNYQTKSLAEELAAKKRKKQRLLKERMERKKRERKVQLQEMGASESEIEQEMEQMEAELGAELEAVEQESHEQLRQATASMSQAQQFELVSFTKSEKADYSAYLEQIRSGNMADRENMESVMASEKERQKADLQERMQKRKEARLKKLKQKGADSAALAEAEAELDEEAKEETENFEEHQRKMLDMVLSAEDTKKMMEKITSEAATDSNALKLSVEEEKRRQKEDMKRRLAEKKAKKLAKLKAKGAAEAEIKAAEEEAEREEGRQMTEMESEAGDGQGAQEEQQADINEQMQRIVKENEEEREKMELVMQMEQARQRQAMQAKLMAKRERRRKKAAKADAAKMTTAVAKPHFIQPLSDDAKSKLKKMPTVNANTMKYMQQRGWGVGI